MATHEWRVDEDPRTKFHRLELDVLGEGCWFEWNGILEGTAPEYRAFHWCKNPCTGEGEWEPLGTFADLDEAKQVLLAVCLLNQ